MTARGADGGDDTFADSGTDGIFCRAADKSINIRAHGNARLDNQLNAITCDSSDAARIASFGDVDNLRCNADLDGLQHIASCQVNGGGLREPQVDVRFIGGDECCDDATDAPTGEVVRLEIIEREAESCLRGVNLRFHDGLRRYAPQAHRHQIKNAHLHARGDGGNPQSDWDEPCEDNQK